LGGIGNLTKLLAEKAEFVLAVEKDQRYFPILKDVLGDHLRSHNSTPKASSNVEVVFGDALNFNFQELLEPGYKVVANIPYYITGKLIEMLVTSKNKPSKIVLLIQKEVAQRITAQPGDLSILALSVQLFAKPSVVQEVSRYDFYPVPDVDSAILVLELYPEPLFEVDQKKFFKMVKAAFVGKRKQIHNSLGTNLSIPKEELNLILGKAGITPTQRPQEITLEQWNLLYQQFADRGQL
jgi:16S rRNA (adenine1518-N6/adenine1519-N6)-dimethyltransferase